MYQPTRRRRTAGRGAARTLAFATAIAALIATLSAGQALAVPDERVLERQGRIDRQAAIGQADQQDKAEPSQAPSARFPRRFVKPEPPVHTGPPLGVDEQPAPAPPKAPAGDRDGLAIAVAAVALLLGLGAAATWRIHRRRPRPELTT
jgi:1,6-anhydro-N-acetylmuramate kinase